MDRTMELLLFGLRVVLFGVAGFAVAVALLLATRWIERLLRKTPKESSGIEGIDLLLPYKTTVDDHLAFRGDPGRQALKMLQRGENCEWYSIHHNPQEMHEAFDSLEIYWRTKVAVPGDGYGHCYEDRAGFRVRWRVSGTRNSHVEACGLDLMETILAARALVDRHLARNYYEEVVSQRKHPVLETWKESNPGHSYSFHGLDLDVWHVRLEYPGGIAWAAHEDLDTAVIQALMKAPHSHAEPVES